LLLLWLLLRLLWLLLILLGVAKKIGASVRATKKGRRCGLRIAKYLDMMSDEH